MRSTAAAGETAYKPKTDRFSLFPIVFLTEMTANTGMNVPDLTGKTPVNSKN
jgi:hypothetical protein